MTKIRIMNGATAIATGGTIGNGYYFGATAVPMTTIQYTITSAKHMSIENKLRKIPVNKARRIADRRLIQLQKKINSSAALCGKNEDQSEVLNLIDRTIARVNNDTTTSAVVNDVSVFQKSLTAILLK